MVTMGDMSGRQAGQCNFSSLAFVVVNLQLIEGLYILCTLFTLFTSSSITLM